MKLLLSITLLFTATLLAEENPYIDAGMPAIDREWNGRDYLSAQKVLASGKISKPLLSDENGKQVIARITDTSNLAFNRNKSLPIGTRMEDYLQLQQGLNNILRQYAFAATNGERLNAEIAQLMAISLHVAALGVDLVNEFLPTIPRDESYETRMAGLKKMNAGLVIAFRGAEGSLSETDFYTEADLSILLKAMEATLPTIRKGLSEEYREELQRQLTGHLKQFEGEDKRLVGSMLKTLKAEQDADDRSPSSVELEAK